MPGGVVVLEYHATMVPLRDLAGFVNIEAPGPGLLQDETGSTPAIGRTPPSLRSNSVARLVSDCWTLAMSLVAATVAARLLGLAGKGFYSSLILLAGAFIQVFSAGLGEAAVVLVGQGRYTLRMAASATWAAILPLSGAGVGLFLVVARLVLRPTSADARLAVVFAAVLVGVMVCHTTASLFLLAQERVVWASALAMAMATVTTTTLWLLMAMAHMGTRGAVLGSLAGATITCGAAVIMLWRVHLLPRPRWSSAFLAPAVRLGSQMQVSNLLVTLTARVDLILVYRLRGAAVAGGYSVALTVGALVGIVPVAISYASFPRLAWLGDDDARTLTTQLFRVGMLAAMALGAALALITPFLVPVAFGSSFKSAIAPSLLLIPGGILWSGQWLLARAAAARGRPRALSISFTVNFLTMVTVDLLLIGPLGAVGAGVGTLVASAAGLAVAGFFYRGPEWRGCRFVPGVRDFADLWSVAQQVFPSHRP